MFVSQHPAVSRSFPSGPKLICCGQIVCRGKMWAVVWTLWSPHEPPLFVSAPPDSCSSHSWEREAISRQFHPSTPSCLSSIRQLPSCCPDGLFFKLLNPGWAYKHMETKGMCIPGIESFEQFVFRSSGRVERKNGRWLLNIVGVERGFTHNPPTWKCFNCMKTFCGTVFEAQGRTATLLLDHFNNLFSGSKQ